MKSLTSSNHFGIDRSRQGYARGRSGEELKLSEDELAFYDALEVNDSAVKVLGDDTLKGMARELVKSVHENATIDWTMKENVRAKLRVMVRRILRKYGYPPDKQEKATQTVLEQAEVIAKIGPVNTWNNPRDEGSGFANTGCNILVISKDSVERCLPRQLPKGLKSFAPLLFRMACPQMKNRNGHRYSICVIL